MNRWFNGGLHTLADKGAPRVNKDKDGYYRFTLYWTKIESSYPSHKVMYNPFFEAMNMFEADDMTMQSLQIRENYVLAVGVGGGETISIRYCECGGQLETSSETGVKVKVGHEPQCDYGEVEEVLSV